jgi:hypothetical protein
VPVRAPALALARVPAQALEHAPVRAWVLVQVQALEHGPVRGLVRVLVPGFLGRGPVSVRRPGNFRTSSTCPALDPAVRPPFRLAPAPAAPIDRILGLGPLPAIVPISELDLPPATDPESVIVPGLVTDQDPVIVPVLVIDPGSVIDRAPVIVLVTDPGSAIARGTVPGSVIVPVIDRVSVTAPSRGLRVNRGRDRTVGIGTTIADKPFGLMRGRTTETYLAPIGGEDTPIFMPTGISTIGRGDTGGGRLLGGRSPVGSRGDGRNRSITTTAATSITRATRST